MSAVTITGLPEESNKLEAKQSVPIMTRLYAMVKTMSNNPLLMANGLMRKAVNYLLNQWNKLRNMEHYTGRKSSNKQ